MKNQFWAVGRWSGLDCEIRGSGPIMSNFWGLFFYFFGAKKFFKFFFENTIASAQKSYIIPFLQIYFLNPKKWKNGPQKLLIIGPDPFISQSSPDQRPTAQNWFFILRNLGTRHLFSYLCVKGDPMGLNSKSWLFLAKSRSILWNSIIILKIR